MRPVWNIEKEVEMAGRLLLAWVIATSYGVVMGSLAPPMWARVVGGGVCLGVCAAVLSIRVRFDGSAWRQH